MTTRAEYVQVFAVIRVDLYNFDPADPALSLRAVEILPTIEEAERERDRLKALALDRLVEYVVSASHWYPFGRDLRGSREEPKHIGSDELSESDG